MRQKALDMVVMGPNCAGYINFGDDIFSFAFIGDYKGKKGNIGFVSQSGQFCIDMMKSAEMKYSLQFLPETVRWCRWRIT